MGGAFPVACCVAPSGGFSGTELACLRAPLQPRNSAAAPTTSISVTDNRVRFATRIAQRCSLRLWITPKEKKGGPTPTQNRVRLGDGLRETRGLCRVHW